MKTAFLILAVPLLIWAACGFVEQLRIDSRNGIPILSNIIKGLIAFAILGFGSQFYRF